VLHIILQKRLCVKVQLSRLAYPSSKKRVQRTQLHLAIGKYLVIVSCFMGETETRKPAMLRPKPKSAKWKFSAWLLTFTRGTFNFGSLTLANTQRPRRKCRGNSDPKSQSFGAMKIYELVACRKMTLNWGSPNSMHFFN